MRGEAFLPLHFRAAFLFLLLFKELLETRLFFGLYGEHFERPPLVFCFALLRLEFLAERFLWTQMNAAGFLWTLKNA